MAGLALQTALDRQAQVGRCLAALVRLGEMEQRIANPYTWEAVLACKDREIAALAALDFPALQQECRELAASPEPQAARLAELMTANAELLGQVCALEQAALERAAAARDRCRQELASLQAGTRLQGAYRRRSGLPPARFLSELG